MASGYSRERGARQALKGRAMIWKALGLVESGGPGFESRLSVLLAFLTVGSGLASLTLHFPFAEWGQPSWGWAVAGNVLSVAGEVRLLLHLGLQRSPGPEGPVLVHASSPCDSLISTVGQRSWVGWCQVSSDAPAQRCSHPTSLLRAGQP